MRALFAGQLVELSSVSVGSVVMWPDRGKGKPCYALKIAPHRSANRAAIFQEELLILSVSEEFAIGQLVRRDPRDRVLMLPGVDIALVLGEGAIELSVGAKSEPGDLEIWPDRTCMRAFAVDGDRERPLVDLASAAILTAHDGEQPQRDEVRFPAVFRKWELVRQADKEVLFRKPG
jgi:hypothetical protein